MPKILLDPKDRQVQPVGLPPATKGKRWEHVDALGAFEAVVPGKFETGATTRAEKEQGIISIRITDGVRKDIVLAEERIIDKPIDAFIDTEVKDGLGTIGEAGAGAVGGSGGTRGAVDPGGVLAGRTERVVPR